MIPWLDPRQLWFPDPSKALADPPGLLAAGGDLTPERLLKAYSLGIFPWFELGQPILWWSPDPRAVMRPRDLKLRRSLRKILRNGNFTVSFDADFASVIDACAQPRSYGADTWITPEMASAYKVLHTLGHAHSLEVWQEGALVGGLYGIALGQVFFGESMFSLQRDASKIALCALVYHLERAGFALLDCQMRSAHLEFMGSRSIPRSEFLDMLDRYIEDPVTDKDWRSVETDLRSLAAWQPGAGGNPKLQ
jgi:leucyl/phenylalanyl-tRNA--protein transferase